MAAHEHAGGVEGRRIRQARRELATNRHLTEAEREQTAWKIVHEQKIEEAKLIHMYFDKLTSTNQREQDLALFAIAAFVDSSVIERLVSGSGIVSSVSASRLAASGDSEAAQAAQSALNQAYSQAATAIVFVHLGDPDGSSCTGFFVTPTLLVTFALAELGGTVAFHFDRYGPAGNARVVAVDRGSALMLAELARPMGVMPLQLRPESVLQDETGTMVRRVRDGEIIVRSGPVTKVGLKPVGIREDANPAMKPTGNFEIALSVEPGSAGSPVFDERGLVVGVVVASRAGQGSVSKVTYAVGAAAIASLIAAASPKT